MPNDLFNTLDRISSGVEELKSQLSGLRSVLGSAVSVERKARRKARKVAKRVARKARKSVSANVRSFRKLQGRYMGLVRNLSEAQKARVKQVKASKGYHAALALAAKLKK